MYSNKKGDFQQYLLKIEIAKAEDTGDCPGSIGLASSIVGQAIVKSAQPMLSSFFIMAPMSGAYILANANRHRPLNF